MKNFQLTFPPSIMSIEKIAKLVIKLFSFVKKQKILLLLIIPFLGCSVHKEKLNQVEVHKGTFKDLRDGQVYKWVRLKDGKKWMAQNLNFKTANSSCYANQSANCTKYGQLYPWIDLIYEKACPAGWHLPTDEEWKKMVNYYGGYAEGANAEAKGQAAYAALIEDMDIEFSATLGGFRVTKGSFHHLDKSGTYWSNSEHSSSNAWYYNFASSKKDLYRGYDTKRISFSCRCLEN